MSYQSVVLADSPSSYWRLQETSGTSATDSSSTGTNTGTYAGTVTLAQTGPTGVDTNAVLLNGSTENIQTTTQYTTPSVYSIEMWFKTSTTSGGYFATFDNTKSGSAASDDRNLYMENNGTLGAYVWTGSAQGVQTTASYNDGNWHHVVAVYNGTSMSIYVDGVLSKSAATSGTADSFSGYWRFGGMDNDSWPGQPTSRYVNATIADIAIYNGTALTSTQVSNHYNAASGGSTPQGTITASGTSTASISGTPVVVGTVSASGTSSSSITGTPVATGTISAQGTSSATVNGATVIIGTIQATGTSNVTVSSSAVVIGTINANGTSSASVSGVSVVIASISAQGSSQVTVQSSSAVFGSISASGASLVNISGIPIVVGVINATGTSNVTVFIVPPNTIPVLNVTRTVIMDLNHTRTTIRTINDTRKVIRTISGTRVVE